MLPGKAGGQSQAASFLTGFVRRLLLASGSVEWEDRYGTEPRKGADILVQALEREGVGRIFAYPGGASMEIHQALTRSPTIRNILCRHEQVLACLPYTKPDPNGQCECRSALSLLQLLAWALPDCLRM